MSELRFAMVGSGWRSRFFLEVAAECPQRFEAVGIASRDGEHAARTGEQFGVPAFDSVGRMLDQAQPDFVVAAVPRDATPSVLDELVAAGCPVLSEVPPAADVEGLARLYSRLTEAGARVQFAEQYPFRPDLAAALSLVATGRLGTISQAQVSIAHGYHGISLIRRFIGASFEPCRVSGFAFESPLVAGPTRQGPPKEMRIKTSRQVLCRFDYGRKMGWMDFTSDQYFSYIRRARLLVRGERGEIVGDEVAYLLDHVTPIRLKFVRHEAGPGGNLEGYYLKGLQLGQEWLWRNEFAPARLGDEHIAIAECMARMGRYVQGGEGFYGPAEACHDAYLDLLAQQAVETGHEQATQEQPWMQ